MWEHASFRAHIKVVKVRLATVYFQSSQICNQTTMLPQSFNTPVPVYYTILSNQLVG